MGDINPFPRLGNTQVLSSPLVNILGSLDKLPTSLPKVLYQP